MLCSLTRTSRTISKENRYYPKTAICLGAFHVPLLTRNNADLGKVFPRGPWKETKEGREENVLYLTDSYSSTQEGWSWGIQSE